jgi:hypothetical protein
MYTHVQLRQRRKTNAQPLALQFTSYCCRRNESSEGLIEAGRWMGLVGKLVRPHQTYKHRNPPPITATSRLALATVIYLFGEHSVLLHARTVEVLCLRLGIAGPTADERKTLGEAQQRAAQRRSLAVRTPRPGVAWVKLLIRW